MKASTFDERFDAGEGILDALDLSKVSRPDLEVRRVNVDLPEWMIRSLDQEARRLGVTRQAIIKVWMADRLEKRAAS